MSFYVDVHCHLTHEKYFGDLPDVIERSRTAGLGAVIVNGLEPQSNRTILDLCEKHTHLKPALGIYPLDAINDQLPADFPHRIGRFDVKAEITWISEQARAGKMIAVGECGLDGYYVDDELAKKQEPVFEALIDISIQNNLPIIIHTRKKELRSTEILRALGAKKVNFHCFGGKTKYAQKWAEEDGWCFSIPANAPNSESFQKMLKSLPLERILTETDSPYLAPIRGERNEPQNVVGTVSLLAQLRGIEVEEAKNAVYKNYINLFEKDGRPANSAL